MSHGKNPNVSKTLDNFTMRKILYGLFLVWMWVTENPKPYLISGIN